MGGMWRRRSSNAVAFLPPNPLVSARRAALTAVAPWRQFSATSVRASALVIVESPAKAKTIQRILPDNEYTVRSCVGHVRELPSSAKRIPAKYKGEAWSRLGVDVENGFRPLYVLVSGKRNVIKELKDALGESDELILATDGDREGEAISWHLVELLKPTVPVTRAVFHEITPEAIKEGIAEGRDVDMNLVQAQETRRILDRLAGYTMSPLLWKKIARGLSAGRVQSVALSLIVQRELDRLRFKSAEYCSGSAVFSEAQGAGDSAPITASLVAVDGHRIARGTDFTESGALSAAAVAKGVVVLSQTDVAAVLDSVPVGRVVGVQKSRAKKAPPVPFITSTLQQECGNKFGMSAGRVMRVAQRLYENGHITYMRTDNPTLSEQAVSAARSAVRDRYGADYIGPKSKKKKTPKAAQAAHEAIRPAGVAFTEPESLRLSGSVNATPADRLSLEEKDEERVYSLIYRRTLASEMAYAEYDNTSITIEAESASSSPVAPKVASLKIGSGPEPIFKEATFRANGRVIVFAGFLRAYEEYEEDSSDARRSPATTNNRASSATSGKLPDVAEDARLLFDSGEIQEHKTKPPARFTDASLVKILEEKGVGRPSTYASIVEKLVDRMYVFRGNQLQPEKRLQLIPAKDIQAGVSQRALVPSLTAFAVDRLLWEHFPSFVDAGFTAQMEQALDTIAAGGGEGTSYLSTYYLGEEGLAATVEKTEQDIDDYAFRRIALPLTVLFSGSHSHQYLAMTGGSMPNMPASGLGKEARKSGKKKGRSKKSDPASGNSFSSVLSSSSEEEADSIDWREVDVLVGPHGPYLEHLGKAVASLPRTILAEELSENLIQGLVDLAKDPVLGEDPENGVPVLIKTSKYGPYVQYGRDEDVLDGSKPPRQGLLPGMDVGDITVELALKLLSLPRLLGVHPETGMEVRAGMGPYGAYVMHEGQQAKYASLKKGEQDVLEIELGEALGMLKEVEDRRKKREAAAAAKAAALEAAKAEGKTGENAGRGGRKKKSSKASKVKST